MNISLTLLSAVAGAALSIIVSMGGVIWWQGAKIDRAASATAQVRMELAACKTAAASLRAQIAGQNAAVEAAKAEGEAMRESALVARDEALVALEHTQARYARLQRDWPDDCVSAVDRVRQEYGL